MRLYAKRCSHLEALAIGEQKTLCKRLVEPSLWMQVKFAKQDGLLAMVDKIEENSKTSRPYSAKRSNLWI